MRRANRGAYIGVRTRARLLNTLSILTLNVWQEQGPWEERIALTAQEIDRLDPDVVLLQEVRDRPPVVSNQAVQIASLTGRETTYRPVESWGGGDEGLAILTRRLPQSVHVNELPSMEGRSRRICLGVSIEVGGNSIQCYTTHLAYRLADGELRERQILAAVDLIERASTQYVVFGGDFNAVPLSDEIRFLRGLTTLNGRRVYFQDAFASCHPDLPGITWAERNSFTDAMSSFPRDRRLDYLFVSPQRRDGWGRVVRCDVVADVPAEDGTYCSDHFGVFAEISLPPRHATEG